MSPLPGVLSLRSPLDTEMEMTNKEAAGHVVSFRDTHLEVTES